MAEVSGVLLIDKPMGMTSHDVVGKIRRLYNTKKVGHTGTLDPLATGVLVVLVGRAAKAAEYLVCDTKEYIAGIKFGITSDTEDITGSITSITDLPPAEEAVTLAVNSFVGDYRQIPPMYSALKIGGRKLVDLARKNITVERESRLIHIDYIEHTKLNKHEYTLKVGCSKGTYIRTLCADIGKKLGCGAVMSSLKRTRSGSFRIENAFTLEQIEKMTFEERISTLLLTESLFCELDNIVLSEFYERLCRNGAEIYQAKIKTSYETGKKLRISGKNGFFALGEVREFENGSAIKAVKLFDID